MTQHTTKTEPQCPHCTGSGMHTVRTHGICGTGLCLHCHGTGIEGGTRETHTMTPQAHAFIADFRAHQGQVA